MVDKIPVERVKAIFNEMGRDSLQLVDELYSPGVLFVDPFHRIEGRNALYDYYEKMYANVHSIRFDFSGKTSSGNDLVLYWAMTFRHARLRGGKPVTVEGCSLLAFGEDGKVVLHRDYFDAGALIYEHIPVLGSVIRRIRSRV